MPEAVWIIGIVITAMVFSFLLWRQRARHDAALAEERRRAESMAGELAGARANIDAHAFEARHLADARVPASLEVHARRTPGVEVPGLARPALAGSPVDLAYRQVLEDIAKAVETVRRDLGGSARMVVEHLLDEAFVRMTRLSAGILDAMERHQDPAVVESLMRLDALASTARHAVQRGLILAGAWPGVQRDTSPLGDVIEAARGRVETHTDIKHLYNRAADVWVHGRVVEPLVVALTELLDNAARHSARPVDVRVQDAAAGYAVVIDDAGIGMNSRQRERANAQMSSDSAVDVTALGDGGRLGFHIVGTLCRQYGFRAEISGPSAFGGTRVVVLISHGDIAPAPAETGAAEPSAARIASPPMRRDVPSAARPPAATADAAERTPSGLPVRQRGAKPSPGPSTGTLGSSAAPAEVDPDEAAAGLANFSRAFTELDEGEQT